MHPALPAAAPCGRPTWSGLLQFSLVGIPLKAYPAVRTRDLPPVHQRHAGCGQRIRYVKQCPDHGPVEGAAIVRAVDYGPDQHVVLDEEALDALRPVRDRALRLEHFVEPADVEPLLFAGRTLYLVPDGPAAEPAYAVLHRALIEHQRWGLGQVVLGGHRHFVLVRPSETGLLLHELHYPEQVRACPRAVPTAPATAGEELRLAGQLIAAASGAVDWSRYVDRAAQELRALVEAQLADQPAATVMEPVLLPLLQALRDSVAAAEPGPAGPKVKTAVPRRADRPVPRPAPRARKRRTA
jgi:DNA end-binding protein Ku